MHQRTKIAVAVAMAINSMAVFAQATAPAEMTRVEVTGSRIRAVDQATSQPILKVTQEQIQKSGLITVGDILNNMTSSGTPDFSKGAVLTSNREFGGQYIDARGLGSQRLLVLVDGKRWTQSVDGFTDISTVPSSMIESIEILKDGASAIYGSDAIAGVVNIILKKRLVGGTASAYLGQNELGDGKSKDFSVAYGANSDNASMMFGLSHTVQKPVYATDRELTRYTYGPDHKTDNLGTGAFGRIRQVNALGNAAGFNQYLNHTGSYEQPGVGADARNPANYHGVATTDDFYNSSRDMMLLGGTALTTAFVKGTIDLPKDVQFKTTTMYSTRSSQVQIAGYPLNSRSQPNFPVYIDKNSYYNPYGNAVAGAGLGQDLFFYRRTTERPRKTNNINDALHIDANFEGDFNVNSMPWNWSAGWNYSKSEGVANNTGNINLVNLKAALGPSFKDANGVVRCGTPTFVIGGCVPMDILGGPSASTPAALDFIESLTAATYGSTVRSFNADLAGEIFALPAGNMGFAVGFEDRQVKGYDRPGAIDQQGLTTNLAALTTKGKYDVKEAYLELNIPVLKGMFLAESLSFNLASRYSDYSNFGETTNSKASFTWKPYKDMLVRGTWAEGFRAPALGDTFGGGSQSFTTYLDVCDMVNGAAKPGATGNPTIRAACLAAGVPSTYRQQNQSGFVGAGGGQSTVPFNQGVGNINLTPETAITKTFGIVFNPSFLPGMSMAIDYFDIEVKNRISGISAAYTLSQCYQFAVQAFCNNIQRDTTGAIIGMQLGSRNAGAAATKGFDLSLNYRFPTTQFGQFMVRTDTTYLDSYILQSTNESARLNYAGDFAQYRVKSNLNLDWSMGNYSATWGTRFRSNVKQQCWDTGDGTPGSAIECSNPTGETNSWGTGYNKLGAQYYHDLNVGYAFPWKGKLNVGVNNIFDKKPRINYDGGASAASIDPEAPIDRFFYVRYNQSF